jgi:hypothetical protein
MDRYYQANTVADSPAVPANNAGGYPANGNPAVGIDGTVPGAWWYHAVTEELRNTIIALGGTPDYTQVNQLAAVLANAFAQTVQNIMAQLAKVATSGQYGDLSGLPELAVVALSGSYKDLSGRPAIPPEYALPPATTSTLGGIIAGPGTTIAIDGTLSTLGQVRTVNKNAPDPNGNVSATIQDAKSIVAGTSASLIQFQGGTGNPLMRVVQCHGIGTYTDWNGQMLEIDTVPATSTTIGAVKPGTGLTIAADGTLNAGATGTTIVNLTAAASVALDLTPLSQGAPEILFNLPIAANTTCALTISNPPASGTLAEFVLAVQNAASSTMTWPSTIHWPQGNAPSLSGAAGKLDTFVIYTQDGGTTYNGFVAGQNQ